MEVTRALPLAALLAAASLGAFVPACDDGKAKKAAAAAASESAAEAALAASIAAKKPSIYAFAPPQQDAAPPPAKALNPEGLWSSPPCKGRPYERRIELFADKSFTAQDYTEPCPPNVICATQGTAIRKGHWAMGAGGAVTLSGDLASGRVAPLPSSVTWSADSDTLSEAAPSACRYVRATRK